MKKTSYVLVLSIIMASSVLFAQKVEVNTSKSSVEWLGKKIGGQHTGNIQVKSGSFELEKDKIVAGNFVIDMTSITNTDLEDDTYNQKLVGHLKSDDFFGVEKFPTATFVVKKSSKFSSGKASITGDITIKGKTESITFDVEKAERGYSAKLEIDRSKFDIKYGSNSFFDNLGDKAIDDMFTLTIELAVN